mmetsp:Transcript_22814/g.36418  ORF Transcript_22814/g.36418 Transcript_22814/m.36418 type:complete len:567 (+) Transcript_22814:65-1765(+)
MSNKTKCTVGIRINNGIDEFTICCGKGLQSIKWLGLTTSERFRVRHKPHGRIRQRESGARERGSFAPMKVSLYGIPIDPDVTIAAIVEHAKYARGGDFQDFRLSRKYEDEDDLVMEHWEEAQHEGKAADKDGLLVFDVELALIAGCGRDGVPDILNSDWRVAAFGHSSATKERYTKLRRNRAHNVCEQKHHVKQEQAEENKRMFLMEIGELSRSDSSELVFYSEEDDLGNTAIQDWRYLRTQIEALVDNDKYEIAGVRKTILLHYRLLRDAYKFYSGFGKDDMNSMSFVELMYLLRDTKVCETKDSDLIARLVTPALGTTVARKESIAGTARASIVPLPQSEINLNRSQFLGSILCIFLSEEIHKVHQARTGLVGDSLVRSPSARFTDFMQNYVAPFLEQKTFTRSVRTALEDQTIIDVFVQNVVNLKRAFNAASSLKNIKANRGLLDLPGFVKMLQTVGFVEKPGRTKRNVGDNTSYGLLSYTDVKSIFAGSQFENEDPSDGLEGDDDGAEATQDNTGIDELCFKEFIEALVRLSFVTFSLSSTATERTTLEKIEFVVNRVANFY